VNKFEKILLGTGTPAEKVLGRRTVKFEVLSGLYENCAFDLLVVVFSYSLT
jgi:hypothetical protein